MQNLSDFLGQFIQPSIINIYPNTSQKQQIMSYGEREKTQFKGKYQNLRGKSYPMLLQHQLWKFDIASY